MCLCHHNFAKNVEYEKIRFPFDIGFAAGTFWSEFTTDENDQNEGSEASGGAGGRVAADRPSDVCRKVFRLTWTFIIWPNGAASDR